MNDIISAIDRGEVTALILLDLSAAFDTVDHSTLLYVLHRRFEMKGILLLWFISYLSNRSQSFFVESVKSKSIIVDCSVPQGSVIGPLVVEIFKRNLVRHHLFADADDKQLYRSGKISEIDYPFSTVPLRH
jgi:retron-type reverse transcriptase